MGQSPALWLACVTSVAYTTRTVCKAPTVVHKHCSIVAHPVEARILDHKDRGVSILCQGGDGAFHLRSGPACTQTPEDGQRLLQPLPRRHELPLPGEHRTIHVQEPALDVGISHAPRQR